MLLYDHMGKCVELKRSDFTTDLEYYSKLIALKFNINLKRPTLSVNEICDLI